MSFRKVNRLDTVARDMTSLVGNTPCMFLNAMNTSKCSIVLKMESENPMGSVKDRMACAIVRKAEGTGEIQPGRTVLVEATSGNTGISIAQIAAARGYRVILTMPEAISIEHRAMLVALGADIVLTPSSMGMMGAVKLARKMAERDSNVYLIDQFRSKFNVQVHEETTGPEIWQQTKGNVDVFIAAVGTGGTVIGVGRYLKKKNPNVKIIAVEPAESPVLAGGKPGPHKLQGIGAGFVPEIFDRSVVDEVYTVKSDDAIATVHQLSRKEGVFCGFSGGANVWAAMEIAKRPGMIDKQIVTVIPSFGERYLSTELYLNFWNASRRLSVASLAQME